MLTLGDEQRKALKSPFGRLIKDEQITRDILLDLFGDATTIVTVGDATTQRLSELKIRATIEIVDGKERRGRRTLPESVITNTIHCKNAPGTLSEESIFTVKKAIESESPVRIIVDGEEDLFVLLVCDMCPDGAGVAYGQPGEGMVVLRVDGAVRDKARHILDSMKQG